MKRILLSLAAATVLFAAEAAAQRDSIEMTDGKKILKISIVEETFQNVVYKKGGLGEQRVPSDKVKDIKYYAPGSDFKTASDAYINEDYVTASTMFEEFADNLEDGKKDALKANCYFRASECYMKIGDWGKAVSGFTYFANTYNNHRLFPDALLNRAKCYINSGDQQKAMGGIQTLKSMVDKKGLGEYWTHEVQYWTLYLNEGRGLDKALKGYKSLYDTVAGKYPDVANKARLRIGRVLIQQKKYGEAQAFFEEITKTRFDADREVVAGAYLGRGTCLIRKDKVTNDDIKEALYDFLRVVVHYSDVGSPQAEAMYWAGFCLQRLGGKDSTKRWQGLYRRIQREWPGTAWAQEAAKQVTK